MTKRGPTSDIVEVKIFVASIDSDLSQSRSISYKEDDEAVAYPVLRHNCSSVVN
jgi:hypothetical protein